MATISSVLVSEKDGRRGTMIYDWSSRKLRWTRLEGARHIAKHTCPEAQDGFERQIPQDQRSRLSTLRRTGGQGDLMNGHERWKGEASQ